ncbi:1,4-dihydroxy-2-naphthoate octaprenyltransferase [bacterium]|nr:1,4-dihydroxy-2-naphthoate octaprenyltransferase [bacterium]
MTLATASIALGCFLAAAENAFQWPIALLCFATAVILQVLSNLANDYGDSAHGADSAERKGPQRAVQSGQISKAAMQVALGVFVLLALGVGYPLVQEESLIFHLVGLAAILAAVAYTVGPKPYGYVGLGDLFVLIFFGVIGVGGSYYLQTHVLNWLILLPALSCGLFCVAVLNVNNIRDLESDRRAGKMTIPVRLGPVRGRTYHWILLIVGLITAIGFTILALESVWQFLYLATVPLFLRNGLSVKSSKEATTLDACLKQLALTTLLFSFTFGIGLLV